MKLKPAVLSNKIYWPFFFFIVFVISFTTVKAQECNILSPGSDAGFDQTGFCAPVTGRVKYFTFYSLTEVPVASLQVEINWGEGKKRYSVVSLGYDDYLKMYAYRMPEATHVYTANRPNPKCSYPVTVQTVVNGKVCGAPKQSGTVVVWDKDNANAGNLLLDPTTYYACPGSSFSVNFTDESTWNCVPPKEKANVNWPRRTTQFVYGTENTITGTVSIDGAAVNSFPLHGPYQEYEDKATGPGGPFSQSATITIPATAKVGERFEVTLNNWNYCNQRPEDPIQRKAIVEIVAQPEAVITVKNKDEEEVDTFCPGEEVRLYGGYHTSAGVVLPADVRYDWTIEDPATGIVQKFENRKNVVLPNGFPKTGQQTVTLKVTNKKTNVTICEDTAEETIALIDAPTVVSSINGKETREFFYCLEDPGQVSLAVTFSHTMRSNEDFTYTYNLYKKNSKKSSPDSTLNLQSGNGVKKGEVQDHYTARYTKPGQYKIQVMARNNTTGCLTVEENIVAIYEKPLPDFTYDGVCAGQPVRFQDNSKVADAASGDKILSWEWDMDYTGEDIRGGTFDTDHTGKDAFHWTYGEAGSYSVALKITTRGGCESIKVHTLDIKKVPAARLNTNYSGNPVCPGDTIRFFNASPEHNGQETFPGGIAYTLFIDDGIAVKSIKFPHDQTVLDYSSFYNPTDSIETYTVWLEAKSNSTDNCAARSTPVNIRVRSGAAAGFSTIPDYSPFEPNCSPKTFRFVTSKATRDLNAGRYKWTIVLDGEIKEEVIRERGSGKPFDTLDYTFGNKQLKYLDYTVILSAEKAGICITPAANTYRIYPNPVPRFTAMPVLQSCDSAVFEMKVAAPAGISDYSWEFYPEPPSNDSKTGVKDDHFFIAYNRPAYGGDPVEYTIKLKAKNFYGCEGEWTEKVIVNPVMMHTPSLSLESLEGAGKGGGCRPLSATFRNTTIGDASSIDYALYVEHTETGVRSPVEKNMISGDLKTRFTYTFQQPGNFKVYLQGKTYLDDDVCVRPLSEPVEIRVEKEPDASFTIHPAEGCGSVTAVIAKTDPDSKFNTWTITDNQTGALIFGPQTYPGDNDPFHQYTFENTTQQARQYKVKLTTENLAGCTASDSAVVTVNPEPKAYFSVSVDACDPYVVMVDHQVDDNPEPVTYKWIWGDGTTSEGAHPSAHIYRNSSYTSALHYNIRLVATSAAGCVTDSSIRIVVHPRVVADFEASTLRGCAPLHVNFTDRSKGAQEEEGGWYVKANDAHEFTFIGHSLLQYTFENNTAEVRRYEVMYVARNEGGCADSTTKEITVQPAVLADFSASPKTEVYSGERIAFSYNPVPGIVYTWKWGDGSAPLKTDQPVVFHSYSNNSVGNHYYEVTLSAEDPVSGCQSSLTKVITVYPALQLTVDARKDTVCVPEVPSFDVHTKNAMRHYWYVGKKGHLDYSRRLQNLYDPGLFENTARHPVTYEVMYVGETAQGYKDSTKAEVVVYPALTPTFTLDGLHKNLPNAVFRITNTTPDAAAWRTSWDFGNGKTSDKIHPGSFEYDSFGQYTITLTISNGFCSASYTVQVTVADAAPEVSFTMDRTEGCWPVTVQFTNTSQFTDTSGYFWDFGDGMGTSSAINPSYTFNKPGNYKVTLQASNRTGKENASFTAEKIISVFPQPTPDFVVRKATIYVPNEPVYVANYSTGGQWYKWDFGDGTVYEGVDQFEPVHYYKKPGLYTIKLIVGSKYGCIDSLAVFQAVNAIGGGHVTIPNAFTPNTTGPNGGHVDQGGMNDVFHPVFKGSVLQYKLHIYNRWGELVFESRDPNIGWDGYYKDRLCNSGIYLYKISAEMADGMTINKVGDITLIR